MKLYQRKSLIELKSVYTTAMVEAIYFHRHHSYKYLK